MAKSLEDMDTVELGKLFPIIISEYNPVWPSRYLSEKALIEQEIGREQIVRIQHIGSTAIPGLSAKPTIDILLEVRDDLDTAVIIHKFKGLGYHCSHQPENPPPHLMFMKGYTINGFAGQAYHVHLRYSGDWDEPYFRDYLIACPELAKAYAQLKLRLKKMYEHDREAYTDGKTEFIKTVTAAARRGLGNRF